MTGLGEGRRSILFNFSFFDFNQGDNILRPYVRRLHLQETEWTVRQGQPLTKRHNNYFSGGRRNARIHQVS